MDGLGFLEALKCLYLLRAALTAPVHRRKMINKEEKEQRRKAAASGSSPSLGGGRGCLDADKSPRRFSFKSGLPPYSAR